MNYNPYRSTVLSPTISLVHDFHKKFLHPVRDIPQVPPFKERKLRAKLILEELQEFIVAAGLVAPHSPMAKYFQYINEEISMGDETVCPPADIYEAADALGDLDVVVNGGMLEWGFPALDIASEIFMSNMSKLGEDGKPIIREDGKILKGPNYHTPDIVSALRRAGYEP